MLTTRVIIEDDPVGGFRVSVLEGEPAAVIASGHIEAAPPGPPRLPPGEDVFELLASLFFTAGDPKVRPLEAGRYLFELLATEEVKEWLDRSAKLPEGSQRTLLEVRSARLSRLPWELMTNPATGWAPFLRPTNPWSRVARHPAGSWPVHLPVRVLFVAGDMNDASLSADIELDAIIRVLCHEPARWHVEYLIAPTQEEFDRAYQELRPHVLHVVAHGRQSRDGGHVLTMREGTADYWELTPFTVSNLPSDAPRVVVLNACRSGAGPAEPQVAWTFKDAFLHRGAAAVVTMQGDIPASAAVAFGRGFYSSLGRSEPIDLAATRGRWELSRTEREDEGLWSLPCLIVAGPPAGVLTIEGGREAPPRVAGLASDAARMLDHASARRRVWHQAAPVGAGSAARPHVIVVTGPREVGKSAVVKAALPACHVRGHDIVYVDFRGDRRLNWFGAIKRLHRDLVDWLPAERSAALCDFEHAVDCLRAGEDPTPRPARGGRRLAPDAQFDAYGDDRDDRIGQTFRQVIEVLRACADQNRMVLVLDHLASGLSDEAREYVVPQLVEPLASGAVPRLTLVTVVVSLDILRGDIPQDLLEEPIELTPFDATYVAPLLHELHARRFPDKPAPDWLVWLPRAIAEDAKRDGKKKFLAKEVASMGETLASRESA